MYLIFDTETTGLPKNYNAPITDLDNWPRLVQLAWQLHDHQGKLLTAKNYIIKPDGFTIPFNAEKVHGISTDRALKEGHPLTEVLEIFAADVAKAKWLIGHNVEFDIKVTGAEFVRADVDSRLLDTKPFDTKEVSTEFVAIPNNKGGFKWPTLTELHTKLFGEPFEDAHDAAYDVDATARCFFGLLIEGVAQPFDDTDPAIIRYERPQLDEANFAKAKTQEKSAVEKAKEIKLDEVIPFSHLHVHSQFSLLQSTANVKDIIKSAKKDGMPAVAITDHGALYGAFNAVSAGEKEGIKVIIGCEFYVAEEHTKTKFTKDEPDRRIQQVLLAKNQQGYKNLSKLSSYGFIEGLYGNIPRISRELIKQYKEHLIALTGNLDGEIPDLILNKGEEEAEQAFIWWLELFEDDFYVELMRHGLPEEDRVNEVLLRFAKKYKVKAVATNNVYYINESDAIAHDVVLCVKEGKTMNMEVGYGRRNRKALPNNQFYFKTQAQMNQLFADMPEVIENTNEIIGKCSPIKLKRDILLPRFSHEGFADQDEYLKHLTFEGAKVRYGDPVPDDVANRLNHELKIIKDMGFPGYFLIVQDFINEGKKMGVSVGPGRGSAAGSAVAYCVGITNIDPIKYSLLFERFLNPERVSMPDIDIDFDDRGRAQVIDWVVSKYGKNQVAQIINYSTMAAKMAIKDVARALDLPLSDANYLAKLVPSTPGTTLNKAFEESEELKQTYEGDDGLKTQTLQLAKKLEGCVRGTGIHAAGVIIAPDDLLEYIPLCVSKDADLLVTQFDGKVVEDAGMLKMDFLGLKTLTVIKDAVALVEKNHGVKLDMDQIPLDDQKTFELYQRGETVGTFQFESEGMRMHLRDLKPTNIEDLIAMNALYRPGPMQFIPNFIHRKHGKEAVEYPHPLLEDILQNTYGIMVYQEQIMQTAQILAGFSLGKADILRRAMGKKKFDVMEEMKAVFVEGAKELHNVPKDKAEEVFAIMEKFAAYGFNRSHSAAYSVVAYQTGFLKANYPAEYMASVLSHSMGNIEKITFFMEECKRMGRPALGPDINESAYDFDVNDEGAIRFGLAAIKGAGDAAVENIIEERRANGPFKSIWDFIERVNLRQVNKKTMEALAYAGAFDCFPEIHRAQYFHQPDGETSTGLEKILRYGAQRQQEKNSAQASLFGGATGVDLPKPSIPPCDEWIPLTKLNYEKDVVGFYITGHPLDVYKTELKYFCKPTSEIDHFKNKEIKVGGIITSIQIRQTKNGETFALFTLEDYDGTLNLALFRDAYHNNAAMLKEGTFVVVEGRVQERYNSPGQWELSPKNIRLLGDIMQRECKQIRLKLNPSRLNEHILADLQLAMGLVSEAAQAVEHPSAQNTSAKHRGYHTTDEPTSKVAVPTSQYGEQRNAGATCKLIVDLVNDIGQNLVTLPAKRPVKVSNDLFAKIDALEAIECQIS